MIPSGRKRHSIGAVFGARTLLVAITISVAGAVYAADESAAIPAANQREALFPLPPAPNLDPAKVDLGRHLFYDPILSKRQTLSCSSCHDLKTGARSM